MIKINLYYIKLYIDINIFMFENVYINKKENQKVIISYFKK